MHKAVAKLLRQMELHVAAPEARQLVGDTRPVLVHMRSDERGDSRLAAIWGVEGLDAAGEILLHEEPAGQSAALVGRPACGGASALPPARRLAPPPSSTPPPRHRHPLPPRAGSFSVPSAGYYP